MSNQDIVTSLTLTGLHCQACQKIIQKKIMQINGVKNVDVSLNGKTVITANQIISNDQVANVLKGMDYEVIKSS